MKSATSKVGGWQLHYVKGVDSFWNSCSSILAPEPASFRPVAAIPAVGTSRKLRPFYATLALCQLLTVRLLKLVWRWFSFLRS
jgi:hypothetical protein